MKKNQILSILCFCILFISTKNLLAQNIDEYSSYQFIENGIKLHEEEKYQGAINEFKKVNKNDTNFVLAVLELANSYIANKQDSLAVLACNQALHITSPYAPNVLLFKANALDNYGKSEEAIKIYEEGMKKYPLNYSFYYELGILKLKQKKYAEANELFKKTIKYNPYHAGSHMQMGNIAVIQGKIVPAMLAWSYYLTLDNSSDNAQQIVVKLEKLAQNEFQFDEVVTIEPLKDLDDFSEIEALVKSKVALSAKYKSQIDLNYNINKQLQLILEKITVDKSDKGFYMQFYVPLFSEIYKKGYFEPLVYGMFSDFKLPKVDSWFKKNKSDYEKYILWLSDYIGRNYSTFETVLNGKPTVARHWYFNGGKISGVGNISSSNQNSGYWNFYYSNGILKSEGAFNNQSQQIGVWKFYYPSGLISYTDNFVNGLVSGAVDVYYTNGSIKINKFFKNDLLDGVQTSYYPTGVKENIYQFKDGKQTGKEKAYYPNGKLKYDLSILNEKYDGEVIQYYENGHLKEKSLFKNGIRNGKNSDFYNFPENAISVECTYIEGIVVGDYKSYHTNGKLESVGKFNKAGKKDGIWKSFYDNDTLATIETFDNGKSDGIIKQYDKSGRLTTEFNYKNDFLLEYKAFSPKGKIVYQNKNEDKKNYTFSLYFPNGNKKREGKIIDGASDGEWKYYDRNGFIFEKTKFAKGFREGKSTTYYEDGKIKSETTYSNDEIEGYYKEYYKQGRLYREGVYAKDKFHGTWKHYYRDGTLEAVYFYKDNELDGWQEYYTVTGKLETEEYFELGYLKNKIYYDSTGNIIADIPFNKGTGEFELKFKNGNTNYKYTRENDLIKGVSTSYYPNGQVRVIHNYVDGYLNGESKYFHPNGKIQWLYNYINGKKHGKQIQTDEDGNLMEESEYEYGKLNGKNTTYFPNKKVKFINNYKDSELEGIRYMYDESGELMIMRTYEDGYLQSYTYMDKTGNLVPPIEIKNESGNIKAFYKNGQPSIEYTLKYGYIDGKRITYFPNGKIASEEFYINGSQTGESKYYYASGKIKSIDNYSYDELNGKSVDYYENGIIKSEKIYINDNAHGAFKNFDINGKLTSTNIYYNGYMIEQK